jgi:hypothetical protein
MLTDLYLDQPQCTVWKQSRWVCTIARNSEPEGHFGEHSEILYSDDRGASWTTGIRLEPLGTPTNSYGNILQTSYGRIYVVYNMNLLNVTHFPDGQSFSRDDELGFFVARYSDDGGNSWSAERLTLPQRITSVDRNNSFNGSTLMFWSVDQVKLTRAGATIQGYTKIGKYVQSAPEQSFFITSPNIMTETNASAVTWNIFPEGDDGVAGPTAGMQWEEAHVLPLESSSGLFSIARTSVGYLGAAVTTDGTGSGGWVLTPSGYMTYSAAGGLTAAAGRRVKNPEGPITLKRFPVAGSGKCLLLFYFNSCPGYQCPSTPVERSARNPYFLSSGWEEEGEVRISQPEVVLYDLDLLTSGTAAGYPDFIEDAYGAVWVTETNKTHARSHKLDAAFLTTLFAADTLNETAAGNLTLSWTASSQHSLFMTPPLPNFASPLDSVLSGLTIGLWLDDHDDARPGQVLIDLSPGLYIGLAESANVTEGSIIARLTDSVGVSANLTLDADCTARLLESGSPHYFAVTLDVGAHILSMSVDGVVCDGGANEAYGWAWVPPAMGDLNSASVPQSFNLGENYGGRINGGAWYSRRLLNTEVVGNFRHQLVA